MLEKEFRMTGSCLTTLSSREKPVGLPKREDEPGAVGTALLMLMGHSPKAAHQGWAGDKDRTLPSPNNCQARQDEESGPRSTWGPSQCRIHAGDWSGHGASCGIAQAGTDGHGGAFGDMTLRAVTDSSFRNYA